MRWRCLQRQGRAVLVRSHLRRNEEAFINFSQSIEAHGLLPKAKGRPFEALESGAFRVGEGSTSAPGSCLAAMNSQINKEHLNILHRVWFRPNGVHFAVRRKIAPRFVRRRRRCLFHTHRPFTGHGLCFPFGKSRGSRASGGQLCHRC